MRVLDLVAVAAALTLAGTAQAQDRPAPATPPPPPPEMRGPDDLVTDFTRMQNDVAGRAAGPTRSPRPVPLSPEDITPGSEVRDSKGVVIGSIEKVGMGFAVVVSPGGKIEVEFASFAKNNKGLLINMPKAKFDAIVAGSHARSVLSSWRYDYNHVRPHSGIGGLTPADAARQVVQPRPQGHDDNPGLQL